MERKKKEESGEYEYDEEELKYEEPGSDDE